MHPILLIIIIISPIMLYVIFTRSFPVRLPSKGFKYVYVDLDGTVRELSKEEKRYLQEEFHPNDGARPYIKLNYWQKTPDGKIDGYLKRIRVPWWISIKPITKPKNHQFDISKYCNKISFTNQEDYESYPVSEISCPKCKTEIKISFSDLKKHQYSDYSNLTEHDQIEISKLSQGLKEPYNSFLDYNCLNCKTGIRIYYESWAGGKHGEHGYLLRYILTT